MNIISKMALLVAIIAALFLLISGSLISSSPIIIVIQLLAIALSVWARRSFQETQFSIHAEPIEGKLMVTGPYRYIRHPMYTSALLIIWSSNLGHLSFITFGLSLVVTFVIAVRIVTEEQFLRVQYPEYEGYSLKVKRLIPFIF